MVFSKIKKAAILLMLGLIVSFASESFASVTWLSSVKGTEAPSAVAVDARGNLYVTELYQKDRLLVFDRHGVLLRTLSGLTEPTAVAVDSSFRIYVATGKRDARNVAVYNADLSFSHKLGIGDGEFSNPASIAVSAAGLVYVSDAVANVVKVYSSDGKPVNSFGGFGRNNGQFNTPLGLAIDDANGEIYVTDLALTPDSTNGNTLMSGARVQVFDLSGVYRRSFGQFGTTAGQMGRPVNISLDKSGNAYIADAYTAPNSFHVFTGTGSWIETVSDASHPLKNGLGIAVGKDGRLFVSSLNGPSVEVYGLDGYTTMDVAPAAVSFTAGEGGVNPAPQSLTITNSGTGTLNWTATAATKDGAAWLVPTASGTCGPNGGTSSLAIGVDVAAANLAAGTYTGTVTITGDSGAEEKIAVSLTVTAAPPSLSVTPSTLSFTAQEGTPNPAAQIVSISSNAVGWVASAATSDGAAWLVPQPSGTVTGGASTASIAVDIAAGGLHAGNYAGTITLSGTRGNALTGAQAKIAVSLTVLPAPMVLNVTPQAVTFKAQQNGPSPQAQAVSITNLGTGTMPWSATASADWIGLSQTSANNTGSLTISPVTSGMQAGTQTGSIQIAAPGAQKSPQSVAVTVQIVYAGTVKVASNLSNAEFTMAGPATYNGSGAAWSNDEVTPGDYTITFKHVSGYLKPVTKNVTVKTGQEVAISGDYRKKPAATHIVAGSASNTGTVTVLTVDGAPAYSFTPFKRHEGKGVRVATGDLDGSGFDKIVATDGRKSIKVLTVQGNELASYDLSGDDENEHLDVSVADIDGDGKAEVLAGFEMDDSNQRTIRVLTYSGGTLAEKATLYTEKKEGRFSMAVADINGDGAPELLLADGNSVRAFAFQQAASGMTLTASWAKSGEYGKWPQIAAGDVNDDEAAEIAVSYEQHNRHGRSSVITVLKGTGEKTGTSIQPFKDLRYDGAATVAVADVNADGVDEYVVGAGPDEKNDPIIRIYGSDGTYAGVTMKPMNGKFGVNVAAGRFE